MKTKCWLFVTLNAHKVTLELDQCAIRIVQQAILTSWPSAISPRVTVEEWVPSSSAKIVRNGDSCGTQNARKDSMPSLAACASPSAHKVWQI